MTQPDLTMNPYDEVRAQLGRQKWAVDSHDTEALADIYTRDCTLILKAPDGRELGRQSGRETIIRFIKEGWAANTDWTPGSMIHHIGTDLIEPGEGGMIRCRSYALYIHLVEAGGTEIHGYGKYYDLWALEDGHWRLHQREVHLHGMKLPA